MYGGCAAGSSSSSLSSVSIARAAVHDGILCHSMDHSYMVGGHVVGGVHAVASEWCSLCVWGWTVTVKL
jgi:hypothetical protein